MRLLSGTTILTSDHLGVMIVDVSTDRRFVIITTPEVRQEGSPESALVFASKMRMEYGDRIEALAEAVERAARFCMDNFKGKKLYLQ